jgi:hypothetical protein
MRSLPSESNVGELRLSRLDAESASFCQGAAQASGEYVAGIQDQTAQQSANFGSIGKEMAAGYSRGVEILLDDGERRGSVHVSLTRPPKNKSNDEWPIRDTFYGGIHFGTRNVFPANSGSDPNDQNMYDVLGKRGREYWCRCAIFHMFGNGDCLGFDTTVNYDDPAVIYLVHDDKTTKQVSPNFTEFLTRWTKAAFLWPNNWGYGVWPFRLTKAQRGETAELLELAVNAGF